MGRPLSIVRRGAALAVVALVTLPVRAMAGGVGFDYPDGAESATYVIKDSDVLFDDPLDSGTVAIPPGAEPGDSVTVGLGGLFCNQKGEVAGPDGSSGEGSAEVLIEVTWTFPGGAQWVETKERRIACPQPATPS